MSANKDLIELYDETGDDMQEKAELKVSHAGNSTDKLK